MSERARKPKPATARVMEYRQRMRAAGLKPLQIWVPDPKAPGFAETCRRQARAVAAFDPAGDEIMGFIAGVYEWPRA